MQQAIERGLIPAEPIPVNRTHVSGVRYRDVDWSIPTTDSLATMLNPWATFRPAEPKQRKPRTLTPPCKVCGEVHPITQIDYCEGCGAEVDRRTIEPKTAEEGTLDNLSQEDLAPEGPDEAPSTQDTEPHPGIPRLRIVAPIEQGTHHNPADEPAWLHDAPEPPPDDTDLPPLRTLFPLPPTGCRGCGNTVAEGQRYCSSCDPRTA
jgi:hypothetical protein